MQFLRQAASCRLQAAGTQVTHATQLVEADAVDTRAATTRKMVKMFAMANEGRTGSVALCARSQSQVSLESAALVICKSFLLNKRKRRFEGASKTLESRGGSTSVGTGLEEGTPPAGDCEGVFSLRAGAGYCARRKNHEEEKQEASD
jgi:hypothetical protein